MGQTLLRLKQLKIGEKRPWKYSFTLVSFSNEANMFDLSKYLSRQWATNPNMNQLCCTLIEEPLYKLQITLRYKKINISLHYKLHLILSICCMSILTNWHCFCLQVYLFCRYLLVCFCYCCYCCFFVVVV